MKLTINGVDFPWPTAGLDIVVSGEPGDPVIGPVRVRVEGEVHIDGQDKPGFLLDVETPPRHGEATLYIEGTRPCVVV